jgi:DNA repair protein RecN (Recombination protein N)
MLRELRIKNLAVVEAVTVPFAGGFNVLTGETGAGKSILVDALLLVCGGRAQGDVIRTDAESGTVEAVFDVFANAEARAVLEAAGLSGEEGELVVRRELARSGRHRAFVNDSAVTVGLLERLGQYLVEVHGQHEHQRLLEPARQLALLDRFADVEELAGRVAELYAKYQEAQEAVERGRAAERDRAQREDLLRFQVSELDAARLRPGEEEELRTERRRHQHTERFVSGLVEVTGHLVEASDSATDRVARATRVLRDLGRLDPSFAAPAEALEVAAAQIEDALASIQHLSDSLVFDPGRLELIEERLDALARLRRKYGDSEEAMIAFREAAAAELARLARHEEILVEQERMLGELVSELGDSAARLADRRAGAAGQLQTQAQREMRRLGMDRAVLDITIDRRDAAAVTARGVDRVEFRFSANPGEEPRPLARVASGGELARIMLALTTVLAAADAVPTMIFDEVDAGVGGRLASVVADTLAAAARGRQVLCVTHLAQIAARADHHVRVEKTVRGGRSRASATALGAAERVDEVARMLAGDAVTDTARRHARELLAARRSRDH